MKYARLSKENLAAKSLAFLLEMAYNIAMDNTNGRNTP
jgi:hypothetical protein